MWQAGTYNDTTSAETMAKTASTLSKVIHQLRELNEPVPKPLHLPSAADVAAAERALGVTFHPDYRKFLLEASDVVYGVLEPATVGPNSAHTDLVRIAHDAWTLMGLPRELLPVCEDNGDYYCMNASGEVVYWSHDGAGDERWPDLATWVQDIWIGEN
jgi:hypothetical protein